MNAPEVLELARAYYEHHPVGGALHIALDDGNLRDSDLEFCRRRAERDADLPGVTLATHLLACSKTQRRKVYASL